MKASKGQPEAIQLCDQTLFAYVNCVF